ncbi:helix-turn-helix domain-containing protein [Brucella gallinifaecis]|uniref:Helix-turn-helix transcriptional regulator n=1 Tax=Brucella gallinifaecis TaxID=215590 RepID=A0A502BTB3_9HYPH|nr:AraC family transcriptional regulator [Brucella gallinifaecis]TPF77087.1 helix-turn-helix transcriptional regulator [Brucella gallinifaecis]
MSLNTLNYEKNHSYQFSSSDGLDLNNFPDDVEEEFFAHTYSPKGISVYAPENILAIILLKPVRNLKWKNEENEEISSSCAAGTVFLLPENQGTLINWPESVEILKVFIGDKTFIKNTMSDFKGSIDNINGNVVSFNSRQCLHLSKIIIDGLQDENIYKINYIKSLYLALVYLILKNAHSTKNSTSNYSGLSSYACRQIESYLKEHFHMPVSVPEMAAMLGISAGHFATRFRESFGQPPHQYLMSLRLDEAEKFLVETDLPISEIAARLSFASQSHLTTALKKYRQLTPGEIRRRRKI